MPSTSELATADLWDAYPDRVTMLGGAWRSFGGRRRFSGPVETLRTMEDHAAVRAMLEEAGGGRVLVIEAGDKFAMLGEKMARLAAGNGWSGVVIDGVVRDSAELPAVPLAIVARGTTAARSFRVEATHVRGGRVVVGGVPIEPGMWIHADEDAILVTARRLSLPAGA